MTSLSDLDLIRSLTIDQIITALEEEEETQDLLLLLDSLETTISTKVDAIAATVAAQEATVAYLTERRDYFDSLIKSKKNALTRFKTYIKTILERREDNVIAGREAKLKLVSNGGKQSVWLNPEVLPQDFPPNLVTIKTTYVVDNEAIREHLAKTGELVVDGNVIARLEERGTHLRIGK